MSKKDLRTVVVEKRSERLWLSAHKDEKFGYGLVIGVPSLKGPDYIIHMAFTNKSTASDAGNSQPDLVSSSNPNNSDSGNADGDNLARSAVPSTATAADGNVTVDVEELIEHALNALRMLPGCCYILGLFTIEKQLNALDSVAFAQQVKALRSLAW